MSFIADWWAGLGQWWDAMSTLDITWLAIGLAGQSMFFLRFLIQWISTERARKSTVPEVFWYLSCIGAVTVFAYGVYRTDPVLILGQSVGLFVYLRNIYFIRREKRADYLPPVAGNNG